jgi:hypothetical protein
MFQIMFQFPQNTAINDTLFDIKFNYIKTTYYQNKHIETYFADQNISYGFKDRQQK